MVTIEEEAGRIENRWLKETGTVTKYVQFVLPMDNEILNLPLTVIYIESFWVILCTITLCTVKKLEKENQ